jgi:hypothetical protein
VVLHHVAQRAGLIVELRPSFDADVFGDRDLHMLNATAPPQRLEQHVAEPQRQQILHRLFAEVVIDAEDLLLAEHRTDALVDQRRALQVLPERLFEHDTRCRRNDGSFGKAFADTCKQVGGGR